MPRVGGKNLAAWLKGNLEGHPGQKLWRAVGYGWPYLFAIGACPSRAISVRVACPPPNKKSRRLMSSPGACFLFRDRWSANGWCCYRGWLGSAGGGRDGSWRPWG